MAPSSGKVAVRILADDLLPIRRGLEVVATVPISTRPWPVLASALLVPPLIYLALLITLRRQQRFAADASLKRKRTAMRNARKALAGLKAGVDERAAAELGSRCLRTYIGDKLGLEGSALTPGEVRQHLGDQDVDEELTAEIHGLLKQLEAAQYGAATVAADRLGSDLKQLLIHLDRHIKG